MKKYFKYNYQDALLFNFMFLGNDGLMLNIKLDNIMNPNGPIDAQVTFHGIQNFDEIKKEIMNFKKSHYESGALDEMHSISKVAEYTYLIEFSKNDNLTIFVESADFNVAIQEL